MAGILPLLDLSLFYYLHSGREISLGWGNQFSPSLGLLLKPRFPQEASLFPLPPVSAVQVGPLCCRALPHTHRWCYCCPTGKALLPRTLPSTSGPPPSPPLPDCYSTDVSLTVLFLKLICAPPLQCHLVPLPPPQPSCVLCPLSIWLQDLHLTPLIYDLHSTSLFLISSAHGVPQMALLLCGGLQIRVV